MIVAIKDDWEERANLTLRIPATNLVNPDGLLSILANIRRNSFIREAQSVITFMESPSEDHCYGPHFWVTVANPYKQPLPPPNPDIRDLALARCVGCENYFWIEESLTDGHDRLIPTENEHDLMPENVDFTKIYQPRPHEPAVYSCDSPEESRCAGKSRQQDAPLCGGNPRQPSGGTHPGG
jgi:hypothetical protein